MTAAVRAACVWLADERGVEPLTTNEDASSAEPSNVAVIIFIRRGVIHEKWRVAMYERVPVAAAPVVIAPIMQWMHMHRGSYRRCDPVSDDDDRGAGSLRTGSGGGGFGCWTRV